MHVKKLNKKSYRVGGPKNRILKKDLSLYNQDLARKVRKKKLKQMMLENINL